MNDVIIRTLKVLGWVVGIALIALGVGRMLFSMATIPGGGAVNPTVDTETRAGGALLIAMGLAYVWAMRQSPIPSALLRFLALSPRMTAGSRCARPVDSARGTDRQSGRPGDRPGPVPVNPGCSA